MLSKDSNAVLTKTVSQIEAKVAPDMKNAFQRIILAGEKVMYSEETQHLVAEQFKQGGEPAQIVGTSIAKLMGVLMSQSKGSMPMKAAVPAATVLLCEGLDFAEKAKMLKVTPQLLADSMHTMTSAFLQLLGVTPEKLQMLMHKAQRPAAGQQPPQAPAQPAAQPAPAPVANPAPPPAMGGLVAQIQGAPA